MRAFLGIDGGGTRTRSLLVSETGEVLGRATVGPSNVQQVSTETLFENLQRLVDLTFSEAPTGIEYVASCFGLAGAASARNKSEIQDVLSNLSPVPMEEPVLTSDAHIALIGALSNRPGLMLIAGTGSICLGRDPYGKTHRTGGWGPTFDDLGSGSWIGQQAMRAAFKEADGRLPRGPWLRNVLNRFRCDSIESLLAKLKSGEISNPQIASLAPSVIQLAASGVTSANEIVDQAVQDLVETVKVTHRKAKLSKSPLILVGGLMEKSDSFRDRFKHALSEQVPEVKIQNRLMSPIVGAVVVACKKSAVGLPKALQEVLTAELSN